MKELTKEESLELSKVFQKNQETFIEKVNEAFLKKYNQTPEFKFGMNSTPFTLIYDRSKYNIEEEYKTIIKEIWG